MKKPVIFILFFLVLGLAACSPQASSSTNDDSDSAEKLKVVATTTIVGDVVSQVGGDLIELRVLLPVGTDPHSFDPTPQDIARVADADLVFANGASLEAFLDNLITSAGAEDNMVHVSEGVDFLMFASGDEHEDETHADEHEAEDHGEEVHADEHEAEDHGEGENNQKGVDPHTWTDPNNVIVWVENIEEALSQADPGNEQAYTANAEAYTVQLGDLDVWIRDQVAQIPPENRKLVTDHTLFGYFVDEYGFQQVGALIPAYSTLAEPTAQELAAIEDAIHAMDVGAIFVGSTVNPALAERVAEDTGIELVFVYTGSLSEPDGQAATYIEYMRYNTTAFVEALK